MEEKTETKTDPVDATHMLKTTILQAINYAGFIASAKATTAPRIVAIIKTKLEEAELWATKL